MSMLKRTEPVGHIHDIVRDQCVPDQRVLCVTPDIGEIPTLNAFLGCRVTRTPLILNRSCAVIVYGHGKMYRKALAAGTGLELPLLYTDFGPFRTFNQHKLQPLSMTFDHLGFAYAADRETYLEDLIKHTPEPDEIARSEALIQSFKRVRASHFNHSLGPKVPGEPFVVIINEPAAQGRGVDRQVYERLTDRAKQRFPEHSVVELNPGDYAADVLERADAVFTHSSPLGFEALVWGKPLHVSGMPFYAGWGLTDDELPAPERRSKLSHGLAQLTHAYMVRYTRYVNPFDAKRLSPEDALTLLERTRPQALQEARERQTAQARSWLRWFVRS